MHNEILPLADSAESVEMLSEAEYQSVYAELSVSARGRAFLRQHAGRNVDPETGKLVAAIARLEAMRADDSPVPPAEFFRNLTDLAAAVERCERVVAENSRSLSNELFAAERIQDIALAMRRREVEPALCDALDAAAREVVDGIVSNDAAVKTSNAAALLRDVARRVDDLLALASCGIDPQTAEGPGSDEGGRFNATVPEALQDAPQDGVQDRPQDILQDDTMQQSAPNPSEDSIKDAATNAAVASTESVKTSRDPNVSRNASGSREPNDSCAALFALSEAELIALFS